MNTKTLNNNNIQDAEFYVKPSVSVRLVYLFCLLLAWFCAGLGLLNNDLLLTGEAGCLMMSIVFHYSLIYKG